MRLNHKLENKYFNIYENIIFLSLAVAAQHAPALLSAHAQAGLVLHGLSAEGRTRK